VSGEFSKKGIIWSNDPEQLSVALYLEGEVRPRISLEPGGYVSLAGALGSVPPQHLDIINRQGEPVEILGGRTDLEGRIRWEVKVVKPGRAFRLTVEDKSSTPGDYSGHLYIQTTDPKKQELVVIVNGHIRDKKP
jgi:hypothetical protein